MSDANEWEQMYQETAAIDGQATASSYGFSDASGVVTNTSVTSNQSSPNGSRPIRRRSRASKKTPTTLLNADANNFRALVQQFTGCPSTPFSFGSQRGPVNLNFGLASSDRHRQNQISHDHHHLAAAATTTTSSIMASPFSSNYYQQPQHDPQVYQQQSLVSSFDDYNVNNSSNTVFSANSCSVYRADMEMPDNNNSFRFDDSSFHESFNNENKDDVYFS